eukprot:TRINITY_DN29227_c0_g1_i1.p1 TRINITY_DN29227_c0_g1~~TRINITY_DN29227_c0_g1_i1.p1  ORF type:complete len:202 (-),score=18.06 TRINITY_DN29227_c0_g1_i1:493-1029(-)
MDSMGPVRLRPAAISDPSDMFGEDASSFERHSSWPVTERPLGALRLYPPAAPVRKPSADLNLDIPPLMLPSSVGKLRMVSEGETIFLSDSEQNSDGEDSGPDWEREAMTGESRSIRTCGQGECAVVSTPSGERLNGIVAPAKAQAVEGISGPECVERLSAYASPVLQLAFDRMRAQTL